MANTNEERYIKVKAICIRALEWYQKASEYEKKSIKYSDESITKGLSQENYWVSRSEVNKEVERTPVFTEAPDFFQIYSDLIRAISDLYEYNGLTPKDQIEEKKESPDRSFLDGILVGDHEDKTLDTSVLNNYRNWGIDRVCLDGFQNHLPEDSKGKQCVIQFLIDGKWIESVDAVALYGEEQLKNGMIKEIRFADDGVGFDMNNLRFLSSQKTSEDLSVGQFGEGLKLVAMTAVNLGLDMEVQSRNWSARAVGKDVVLSNYRDTQVGEKKDLMKQLTWEVSEYRDSVIKGSRTIFHHPTPELIDYVLKLPDYILALRSDTKPVERRYDSDTYDFKNGYLFCKGIFVKKANSFYSYNFKNAELNPDRNNFISSRIADDIASIIGFTINQELIKDILEKIINYYQDNQDKTITQLPYEFGAIQSLLYRLKNGNDKLEVMYALSLWKKAFEELYGNSIDEHEGVVLKSGEQIPASLQEHLKKYRLIVLPKEWVQFLSAIGVKTDKDVIPDYTEEIIKTSLTEDYGSEIWGIERMFLDVCQNHLPEDTKGTATFIRFQSRDGKWHDYSELPQFKDSDIIRIKISDDGIGYDSMSLGLLASAKDKQSSGKWGEGLKMIAAAALRNGEQLELRSRNWMATPFFTSETMNSGKENEKKIKRLNFSVKTETREDGISLDDGDNPLRDDHGYSKRNEKSSTTFVNPSPELLSYFREVEKYILHFSKSKPAFQLENIDILDMSPDNGRLYIKGIYIPGEHQTMYTYDLKDFNIETRDRNAITPKSMQKEIRALLENIQDSTFIKLFLGDAKSYAENPDDRVFLELTTQFNIPTKTEHADKWINAFQKYFGKKTCIRSLSSSDYSEAKAMHMGYQTVVLPDALTKMLYSIETRDGVKIPDYRKALRAAIDNAIPFPDQELTDEDRQIIAKLSQMSKKILPMSKDYRNEITDIKIYTYPEGYVGDKAAGFAGFGNIINLNISTIRKGLRYSLDTFFHESGHAETGASDEEPAFRDYQTDLLAAVTMELDALESSVADNGAIADTTLSDFKKKYKALTQKLAVIRKILGNGIGDSDAQVNDKNIYSRKEDRSGRS